MSADSNGSDNRAGLFGWWVREIAGIFGAKPGPPSRQLDRALIVRLLDSGLELGELRGGQRTIIGRVEFPSLQRSSSGPGAMIPLGEKVAQAIKANRSPVVLRLPATFGMIIDDLLPQSASDDVRSIISHKIDLLSPWTLDQVQFDQRIFDCGQDGKIGVRVAIAPRQKIAELTARLSAAGLTPDLIDIEEEDSWRPVDLDLTNSGLLRAKRPIGTILFLVLLLGSIAAGSYHLSRQYLAERTDYLARDDHRKAFQARLSDMPALAADIEAKRGDAGFVGLEKASSPSGLIVLEILSRTMPDQSWISGFSLDDGTLLVNGYAFDASRIPALLEASHHFSDVQFRSPSTRVSMTGGDGQEIEVERFGIEAKAAPIWQIEP